MEKKTWQYLKTPRLQLWADKSELWINSTEQWCVLLCKINLQNCCCLCWIIWFLFWKLRGRRKQREREREWDRCSSRASHPNICSRDISVHVLVQDIKAVNWRMLWMFNGRPFVTVPLERDAFSWAYGRGLSKKSYLPNRTSKPGSRHATGSITWSQLCSWTLMLGRGN